MTRHSATIDDVTRMISKYRACRIEKLIDLLSRVPMDGLGTLQNLPEPLNWALVSHLFRSALAAARGSEIDLSGWQTELGSWLTRHSIGGHLVVPVDLCEPIPFDGEMPISVISPAKLISRDPQLEAGTSVQAALDALRWAGYSDFVASHLAIIVTLNRRDLGTETSSWTTTSLRGTIYTDYYESGELFAKDIIHEATHSWLNDALDAYGLDLVGPPLYYSPWKKTHRTAYGMLHSVMAFSRVCNYLLRVCSQSDDPQARVYADLRLRAELERLRSVSGQLSAVLALIDGHPVAELVDAEYRAAIAA